MGDPQGIYVAGAFVITGLVVWVIWVLVRCEKLPATRHSAPVEPAKAPDAPAVGAREPANADRDRDAGRNNPTAIR
jgi:hypothetical protein